MVSSRFRSTSQPFVDALIRPLVSLGLSPSFYTLLGLGLTAFAGFLYATGNILGATFVLIVASVLDVVDGALARMTGQVTAFGGFLDSVTDRLSDALILGGIALYLQSFELVFVVLVGSFLVSYTRARAEMEIEKCDVGVGERADRLIILIAASIVEGLQLISASVIYLALMLLAFLTYFTVMQRIWYTYKTLNNK